MRRTALPLVTTMAALLASLLVLATTRDSAQAAFPGINGKITFLSDRDRNNEIYTIPFRNGTWGNAKRLTFNRSSDKTPSFSPSGRKIVWERGDDLYKMNADGTGQRRIPNTTHFNYEIGRYGSYGGNPAFSPGGAKIIFDKDKNIYTINLDGSNNVPLVTGTSDDSYPVFLPGGARSSSPATAMATRNSTSRTPTGAATRSRSPTTVPGT